MKLIEFNGKIANIKTHCKDLRISYDAVLSRKRETNEPFEEILEYFLNTENKGFKNITCRELVEIDDVKALPKEWCDKLGLNYDSVRKYKARENVSYKEAILHFLEIFCFVLDGKRVSAKYYCKVMQYNYGAVVRIKNKYGLTWEKAISKHVEFRDKSKKRIKNKRLHQIWASMKARCINPKNPNYPCYGGRKPKPIQLYKRWYNYFNFEDDMLESYLEWAKIHGEKDTTIDRWPDKLGNYEPNNVRWATQLQQANNKTNNIIIDNITLAEFSRKHGVLRDTISYRLKQDWTEEEILDPTLRPKLKYKLPCNNGKTPLKWHCINNGYNYQQIVKHIKKYNLEPDEALARYLKNRKKKNK